MSRPIDFKQSNREWKRPASMTDEECGSLFAYVEEGLSISCWRLSWRERLKVLFTGRVWLGVVGGQPPVWIMGRAPFLKGKDGK